MNAYPTITAVTIPNAYAPATPIAYRDQRNGYNALAFAMGFSVSL